MAHMRKEGFAGSYIRTILTDVRWLERNGSAYDSFAEACEARMAETKSDDMRRRYRLSFGILRRYVEDGTLPDRRRQTPLFPRGAYHELSDGFRSVVDSFAADARSRGLKERTVMGRVSVASRFLLSMQGLGRSSLAEVTDSDAMGYFVGEDGTPRLAHGVKNDLAAVLTSDLGDDSAEGARLALALPCLRPSRKNIDYLRPDEITNIVAALSDESNGLSLRDRAIVSLMYHTGIRSVDVVGMRLSDIDWGRDRIELTQEKTGQPLVLPLTAAIGNPLFDYIESERPRTGDDHVFLTTMPPHDPLTPGALGHVAAKVYDAAGVRVGDGRRRGTHLFRHHAATAMVSSGVPRHVASTVLGHGDPESLDHYLSADIVHLRGCALDVSAFPVAEGVYGS